MFKPSDNQLDIFDFVKYGYGNAVISAVAGSGKTTTIIEALKHIKDDKSVLFLAFNKSIVDELKQKIQREKTDIRTTHSLGFSMIRNKYRNIDIKVNEDKYLEKITSTVKLNNKRYLRNIVNLCDYGRFFLIKGEKELKEIANKYGIVPIHDEFDVTLRLLEWSKTSIVETGEIDYTDMIYLPNVLNLRAFKYDFVIVDEAQDLSISQMNLFKKCIKQGSRFIAVGDNNQCINAFAGSDVESFNKLKNESNTVNLPLTVSYRCPKNIVKFAQRYVPEIQYNENAEDGLIRIDVELNELKGGDMILCRYISPIVKLYIKLLDDNVKCFIKGSEVGENLLSLIENTSSDEICGENGILFELDKFLLDYVNNNNDNDVKNTLNYNNLKDEIECIEILSRKLTSRDELINKINEIFIKNEEEGIILSTIHKSKGLEADNVYILYDYLTPSKYAKLDWELKQEDNLKYVSYTRAKKILGFLNIKL